MSDASAARVAIELVQGLRAAGLPSAIGGAIALGVWSAPRATKDADLNVFVREERFPEVFAALESAGCAGPMGQPWTPTLRGEFLRRAREGEVAVAWRDGFRVDEFLPSIPFYAAAEATVREVNLDGARVPVLSPEALAVFKLLFFRDKDLVDLRRLVALQGPALDAAWVRGHLVGMVGPDDHRVHAWDEIVASRVPPTDGG